MRIIVYGLGAIGGTVAGALARSGQSVMAIARGAMLKEVQASGLRLRTVAGDEVIRFPCVGHPSEIVFGPEDVILLTMKTQDTQGALLALREAGVREQPIFCMQNGVENERLAARLFPNVHGVTVMMPASFLTPGEVAAEGTPKLGIFEIGTYPSGNSEADHALAKVLEASEIAPFPVPDVMAGKYGKLLLNLKNILGAALGRGVDQGGLGAQVMAEGEAVYRAAGITWRSVGAEDPRRKALMQIGEIPGAPRLGSSTSQSLARGTGALETDFLNGEIALLGQRHGVPTPLNRALTVLAADFAREGRAPGSMTLADLHAALERLR